MEARPRASASAGSTATESSLAAALQELEHAIPGVLRVGRELLVLAVEEAVRSTGVRDDLVLHAGLVERCVPRVDVHVRDARVVAAHQREDRRPDLSDTLQRARLAVL